MKYILSINYIIWLVVSALFFAAGEFLSKKFALGPKVFYVVLILIAYSFGTLAWLPAILQKNSLTVAGTIWSVLSLMTTVLIGILIFKEKLNIYGMVGIGASVVAIVLMSLGTGSH